MCKQVRVDVYGVGMGICGANGQHDAIYDAGDA